MIMEAAGEITYADKGNMTKEEIDKTIDFMIKVKQDGQFRAFWKSFDESVNLMASGGSGHPVHVVTSGCRCSVQGHSVRLSTTQGRVPLMGWWSGACRTPLRCRA